MFNFNARGGHDKIIFLPFRWREWVRERWEGLHKLWRRQMKFQLLNPSQRQTRPVWERRVNVKKKRKCEIGSFGLWNIYVYNARMWLPQQGISLSIITLQIQLFLSFCFTFFFVVYTFILHFDMKCSFQLEFNSKWNGN